MSSIEIRPVADEERRAVSDVVRGALLGQPIDDDLLRQREALWDLSDGVAAWDGARCVGHVAAFRFRMTLPGGERVATAGYTGVGVAATHTRRGVLRQMMERSMRDARDRGQVVAILRASETPIYGRFGFGHASDDVAATVTTAIARPLRAEPAAGSMHVVERAELYETIPELYDRCAASRVGMVDRERPFWDLDLEPIARPTSDRGAPAEVAVVHRDADGVADAYAIYQAGWDDGFAENPSASGRLRELFAVDAEAERAVWRYLLDIDLVRRWRLDRRPVDDPIRRAFHDGRAYDTRQRLDELWLRLLDVDAALTARSYGPAAGSAVIEVTDPSFPSNDGRWRFSADGAERTDAPADLTADVATLSAAFLGGVAWSGLAASGELAGTVDRDVLDRLDALFAVRPAPFCGTDF